MPESNNAGKDWTGAIFMALMASGKVKRVLDVGVGCGTYSDLGRRPGAEWIGVEAWGPYVKEYKLEDKYDKVIVSDARFLDYSLLGKFDVCFLGDVLEHMTKDEACFVVERISQISRHIFISIPVVHYPQDAVEGNPFQVHIKEDWSNQEVLDTFPHICAGVNIAGFGIYLIVPGETDRPLAKALAEESERLCYKTPPPA